MSIFMHLNTGGSVGFTTDGHRRPSQKKKYEQSLLCKALNHFLFGISVSPLV